MKKSIVIAAAAAILLALASCKSADDDVYPIIQGTPVVPGLTISDMINSKEVTDFSNGTCSEDVVITRACVVKNANFDGKTITIKASKVVLENIKNVNIVVDESVGDGDFTVKSSDILNLTVNGGGSNSIHVQNSTVATVSVSKEGVRIALEGKTSFTAVEIKVTGIKFECSVEASIDVLNVAKTVTGFSFSGGTIKSIKKEDPNAQLLISLSGKVKIDVAEGITFVKSADAQIELPAGAEVKTASESLTRGIDLLAAKDYDGAVKEFRAAYEAEKTDETRMYYALTDLATFSVSTEVKDLLEKHMGIQNYPSELNSLINGSWLKDYAETRKVYKYKIEKLPPENFNRCYTRVSGTPLSMEDLISKWEFFNGQLTTCDAHIDEDGDWISGAPCYLGNPVPDVNGKYLVASWYFLSGKEKTKELIDRLGDNNYIMSLDPDMVKTVKVKDSKFFGFKVPEWLKATDAYNSTLFKSQETTASEMVLLMANLLECNGNGANEAVDAVLPLISAKVDTVKKLASEMSCSTVIVPAKLIEVLNLTSILGDDTVKIGRTELNVLYAALEVIKSGLEYVSAYDVSVDFTSFKSGAFGNEKDRFNALKQLDTRKALAVRNGEMVVKSKATLMDALTTAISSYDEIMSSALYPQVVKDKLNEYGTAYYNEAKELLSAIADGRTIYVTNEKGKLFSTGDTGLAGIDLGKFFTPGALTDLLERDSSGNIQFYALCESKRYMIKIPFGDSFAITFNSTTSLTKLGASYEETKKTALEQIKKDLPENCYSCDSYLAYLASLTFDKESGKYVHDENLLNKYNIDVEGMELTVKPNKEVLESVFKNISLNQYGILDFTWSGKNLMSIEALKITRDRIRMGL